MQFFKVTKRQITIMEWEEQLEKYIKRSSDDMECFRRYHSQDDLNDLIEDCEKLIELSKHAKEAIDFMDKNNIK